MRKTNKLHAIVRLVFAAFLLFPLGAQGQGWSAFPQSPNNWVTALQEDTASDIIYAGGYFTQLGSTPFGRIASFDGSVWDSLGSGVSMAPHGMGMINGEFHVGGEFTMAGGATAIRIAKYHNTAWSTYGNGLAGSVNAVIEYNSQVYAGGFDGIRSWNGSSWLNVGAGVSGSNPYVLDLEIYNGELYVTGPFELAGGQTANGIAKWNGSAWSTLGTGLGNGGAGYEMEVYNGELYVGGSFSAAGSVPANNFAKWNGAAWSAVGTGVSGGVQTANPLVDALKVIGGTLYFGGNFTNPGNYVATWDGNAFGTLGTGMNEIVLCLESFNGDLIAGGRFTAAGGNAAPYLAKWTLPTGVKEIPSTMTLDVYPNPASGHFTLELQLSSVQNVELRALDLLGREIFTQRLEPGAGTTRMNVDASGWAKGMYLLQLHSAQGTTAKRVVIR